MGINLYCVLTLNGNLGIIILRLSALFYTFSIKYWLICFCTHHFILTRSKNLNRYFVFILRYMRTFGGFFIVAPLICSYLLCSSYFCAQTRFLGFCTPFLISTAILNLNVPLCFHRLLGEHQLEFMIGINWKCGLRPIWHGNRYLDFICYILSFCTFFHITTG